MMSKINRDRIDKLRAAMKREGIDAYMIPTADFHNSEYAADHFHTREYFSGFTGSAGTLIVRGEEACLWTDGRYFIQAAAELEGSGVKESGPTGRPFPAIPLWSSERNIPARGSKTSSDGFGTP